MRHDEMENAIAKYDEIDEIYDEFYNSSFTACVAIAAVMLILPAISQQMAASRFPVLYVPPEPTAANIGRAWLEPQASGPSRLRLVAENSTGAFEIVLLGVTT
jgi:hypothetical protein